MAGRWSALLVEPPRAMSVAMALWKAARVRMSRGLILFFTRFTASKPDCLAIQMRSAYTAGALPPMGSVMPRASDRLLIVLAVNIPAQEPAPGQAQHS